MWVGDDKNGLLWLFGFDPTVDLEQIAAVLYFVEDGGSGVYDFGFNGSVLGQFIGNLLEKLPVLKQVGLNLVDDGIIVCEVVVCALIIE